ncbi:MAG: rhomboid family intramembrane serine protease [Candidatus Ozemobacteraceae bacterium]
MDKQKKMTLNKTRVPIAAIIISIFTALFSFYVSKEISGSLFGEFSYVELEKYGGITFGHLKNLELWRLLSCQLIHLKQVHMIYNALSILLLGVYLEPTIGSFRFLLLYYFPGIIGTLASTLAVDPPWNLGTGASQAALGIAAFGLIAAFKQKEFGKAFKLIVAFCILPAILNDVRAVGYPKVGHLVPIVLGILIGLYHFRELPE